MGKSWPTGEQNPVDQCFSLLPPTHRECWDTFYMASQISTQALLGVINSFSCVGSLFPSPNLQVYYPIKYLYRLPKWLNGKVSSSKFRRCKRHGFNPRVWKIHWGRKWQPIPVFLPGKSHGPRSLVGYSPWGHKELDIFLVTEHAYKVFIQKFSTWILLFRGTQVRQARFPVLCWFPSYKSVEKRGQCQQKIHQEWFSSTKTPCRHIDVLDIDIDIFNVIALLLKVFLLLIKLHLRR